METTYTWEDAPGGATTRTLRNRGRALGLRCGHGAYHDASDARPTARRALMVKLGPSIAWEVARLDELWPR
jgi:hypothetical protein